MKKKVGESSVLFESEPVILSASSIVGKKEGEGPLGKLFDYIEEDEKFGKDTWEEAESAMQLMAAETALKKASIHKEKLDYIFAGDLLGQLIATSFSMKQLERPLFGVYAACSTIGEAMLLASMAIDGGFAKCVMAATSSHFASAEKQFRFPLPYGNQRPLSSTWTVIGSGAVIIADQDILVKKEEKQAIFAKISEATVGRIIDFGVKDTLNMGACMAPAACDTICRHFKDFNRTPEDYDAIITGDLGSVGQKILIDLVREKGYDISKQHLDCGMLIYDSEVQDTHAGGSGCGCSAVTFSAYILPKLKSGQWKKVLFLPTGALHSTVSYNEGKSVPAIAHAIVVCGK